MARRVYSDAERAAALAAIEANGGEVTARLSRDLDVPVGTLRRWASGEVQAAQTADVGALKEKAEDTLAAMLETYARKAINLSIEEAEAATAKGDMRQAKESMVSAAVAIEKMLLLLNRPTSRVAVEDLRRAALDAGLDPADVIAEVELMLREGE